jgi:hypothetical protein
MIPPRQPAAERFEDIRRTNVRIDAPAMSPSTAGDRQGREGTVERVEAPRVRRALPYRCLPIDRFVLGENAVEGPAGADQHLASLHDRVGEPV